MGSTVGWSIRAFRMTRKAPLPGILARCIDITERKLAEEGLRASEERYRAIVEEQTELICGIDPIPRSPSSMKPIADILAERVRNSSARASYP